MLHLTSKKLDRDSDVLTWFLDRDEIGFNPVTHESFTTLVPVTCGTRDHCLEVKAQLMDELGIGTERHHKRQQLGLDPYQ